jgi:MFS family permease
MKNTPLLKITLLLSAMMTMMAGAVVAPSLPQINEVFNSTPHAPLLTRLVITLPALFIAAFSPLYGKLIDKTGRKKWLLFALFLYGISGTSAFFAHSLYQILISRMFLGIAVAGIMTISTTLVGDYFKGAERGQFLGLQGAFISLGGVFFITLAGWFADLSWQAPFLIYLFSIPVLGMASLFLYEPDVEMNDEYDSCHEKVIFSYNKGLVGIIYITVFLAIIAFYMVPVQLPFMLKSIEGVSNSMVGYAISVSTFFSAIVSINYQKIKKRFSFPVVYLFAFTLMGLGYFFIAQSNTYNHYLFALAFSGMGVGLLMPTGSLWVMEIAPPFIRGRLIGGVSTSMFLGMFFSPIVVQPFINIELIGYKGAFMLASILLCLFAILFYFTRKKLDK